jgi:hypothetical protein
MKTDDDDNEGEEAQCNPIACDVRRVVSVLCFFQVCFTSPEKKTDKGLCDFFRQA